MGILNNTKEEKPNSYNDIQIKHLESEIRRFEEFPQNGSDQIKSLKERIKSIKKTVGELRVAPATIRSRKSALIHMILTFCAQKRNRQQNKTREIIGVRIRLCGERDKVGGSRGGECEVGATAPN